MTGDTPASSISIVIVTWNSASVIRACLRSLAGLGHEVIVVDNASADGTADMVAEFGAVRLLREAANHGFAGGVNRGLHAARGEFILLLNADTVAHPGAVTALAAVLDATPGCGAVGGALLNEDGSPQHGFDVRRFPTLATWAVDLLLIDKIFPDNRISQRYSAIDQTRDATAPVDVDQPAAACLMVRGDLFRELQGMDPAFFPAWFEDVDFCRRVKSAGWRILHVPHARFTHAGGLAMKQLGLSAFSRHWYRNLQRYVRKHHGIGALLAIKAMILVGMPLRILFVLAMGPRGDAAAYGRVAVEALTWWPATDAGTPSAGYGATQCL